MHDKVIVEARAELDNEVSEIVKTRMEAAFSKLIPNVPFEVKPEFRDSWS